MKGVIEILDIDKKDDEVQIDMFDLINSISQMSYENTYINGYLVLINDDKLKNMQYIFKLKKIIKIIELIKVKPREN